MPLLTLPHVQFCQALLLQAQPAAFALDSVAAIGQEALDYLDRGQRAPADWTARNLAALQQLEAPRGLLRVTAVPAVRLLVQTAGGSSP